MSTNRILELRKKAGLSQIELANAISVHQTAISQWETGKTNPDMSTIGTLADFFDVTIDYLLGRSDASTPAMANTPSNDINLDELEFALFGEVRELDEEDKAELLRNARRMRELQELRRKQEGR